ncbi:MAG: GNAT family N-acetyltransferase [Nocardiopsis sp. BM-2018]|uniref:Ribosomal protein S18 acetylase RimI-like enzyme n=1 Tax=Nocardiopsis metallicus TaxID=179819 RepID=A0A840WDE4_9ACTN|nr:GNAT family N-acetyltransferase [Nocardiopsis metallicus]MBB5490005.1 ribosomal protein S18 acetylase RimI-like enzyme [Nocardiopsis metallicus]QRN79665.1 MAG: GNAT family N-acetyltransferase [Nocardiopsis sp. BM-2018]
MPETSGETVPIEVRRADELGERYRRRIARVFVEGFGQDLEYFARDPERLTEAVEHMLVPERFHVALIDGEPAALASLTEADQEAIDHDASVLRRHLGLVKGTIADRVFRTHFQGSSPVPKPGLAEIGFVASARRFRGRGAAKAVLNHLLTLPAYDEYTLEDIKDTNEPAIRLYERVGFHEYRRREVNHSRWSGFNAYVSMKLTQR